MTTTVSRTFIDSLLFLVTFPSLCPGLQASFPNRPLSGGRKVRYWAVRPPEEKVPFRTVRKV